MIGIKCCASCTHETGRHGGCHATCKRYLAEKAERDAEILRIREAKMMHKQADGYLYTQLRMQEKRARR